MAGLGERSHHHWRDGADVAINGSNDPSPVASAQTMRNSILFYDDGTSSRQPRRCGARRRHRSYVAGAPSIRPVRHLLPRVTHQRDVEVDRGQKDSRVPREEQHLGHRAEDSFFEVAHVGPTGRAGVRICSQNGEFRCTHCRPWNERQSYSLLKCSYSVWQHMRSPMSASAWRQPSSTTHLIRSLRYSRTGHIYLKL